MNFESGQLDRNYRLNGLLDEVRGLMGQFAVNTSLKLLKQEYREIFADDKDYSLLVVKTPEGWLPEWVRREWQEITFGHARLFLKENLPYNFLAPDSLKTDGNKYYGVRIDQALLALLAKNTTASLEAVRWYLRIGNLLPLYLPFSEKDVMVMTTEEISNRSFQAPWRN